MKKALKAAAVLRGIEIRRTRDLAALVQSILDDGGMLPLTTDELRCLNPFALEFRNDDEIIPSITRDELSVALSTALVWAQQLITN